MTGVQTCALPILVTAEAEPQLDDQPRTLEEVGRTFGVTRERIRQIENSTLRKLGDMPEAQPLRGSVG